MNLPLETRLALDPQLCLKNDVDRAVLITRPTPLASRSSICRLLHPSQAFLFSLMDGRRTLAEVAELWAELADKSLEAGISDLENLVRLYTEGPYARDEILVEVSESKAESIRHYEPKDFVMPVGEVNTTERRLRIPYLVYYLPTLFCPQNCIYCYAKTSSAPENGLLSLERLREIFAELSGLGVEVIQMSGGDPFARKDIFKIVEAVFEAGMVADLPTKLGLSFKKALRLKELGVQIVQVSLDSADPATLDFMVGVKNYHRRVFKVLEDLRRAEMSVRVNGVLTPFNVPTAGQLIDYLGRMGNVVSLSFSPYGRSSFCHSDDLFLQKSHLDQVEAEVEKREGLYPHMSVSVGGLGFSGATLTEEEKLLDWNRRAYCTANRDGFVILPDGRVTVCEELYDHDEFIIGDLKRQSVLEMWRSPEALGLLFPDQAAVPDGPCRTCESFVECNSGRGRCWRDVLKTYGWDKPHFPDPRCPQAPAGNRLG